MGRTIPVLTRVPNLLKELTIVLPNMKFHEVTSPGDDDIFKQSEIVICDFDLLAKHIDSLPKAKWVQGTWAGIDKLTTTITKPPHFKLTRFTGDHFGKIMSEYVITTIVNREREFNLIHSNQKLGKWDTSGKIYNYRAIYDMTIGILGVGKIGNRIGQILHCLGSKILAFGRRPFLPHDHQEFSHIFKYYTRENLPELLRQSDYIVNVLPKTTETNGLLDNDILENCKDKESVFINIGRSNVLSEAGLIKALDKKWLSAAILDVFDTEPLPENNPLWKHEKITITPHMAGMTRAKDVAKQFKYNLELYDQRLPLPAVVDFSTGY